MKIASIFKNFLNGLGNVLLDMRPRNYERSYKLSPSQQVAADMNKVMGQLGAKASKVYASVQTPEAAKKLAALKKR
ncbi:MAG: hypothetical protein PHF89_02130 [Eubacteriales bacterium]|nr:hypothetical protein [Eubacteriales bacterium]